MIIFYILMSVFTMSIIGYSIQKKEEEIKKKFSIKEAWLGGVFISIGWPLFWLTVLLHRVG